MKVGANIKVNLLRDQKNKKSLVLNKSGGLTYLEHLIKRLKKIPELEVFLTAGEGDDCEELQSIAKRENLPLFYDPEADRHRRLNNVIKKFQLDAMLDIPAIFTALAINHTEQMIKTHLQNNAEITAPINFPDGAVPLAILSAKACEEIAAAGLAEPYYKNFDELSRLLKVDYYTLAGQRTFFETHLVLFSEADLPRIDYLLSQQPISAQAETKLFAELNYQDKYEILLRPATHYLIEPTNHCNLRCRSCAHGLNAMTREKGFMKLEDFKRVLGHLPKDVRLSLYGSGESFINKNIYDLINACDGFHTCISTNGHFFHSEKNKLNLVNSQLDSLIISIDGASEETYSKYRKRGMFSRITKDIKELIELRNSLGKTKPKIDMQFIVFEFNAHEEDKARILAETLGLDELIVKAATGEFKDDSFSRVRKDRRLDSTKGKRKMNPFEPCYNTPRIYWNGDFAPCCRFSNGQFVMGNLFNQSPEQIKATSAFKEFAHRRAALIEEACVSRSCESYS